MNAPEKIHFTRRQRFEAGKLEKRLCRLVGEAEADLEAYAKIRGFPIIPCDLCGSQPSLQRKQVKSMLAEWEKRHPGRVDSMFRALSDLVPSHLMDRRLFDFAAVRATGTAGKGDRAFDREA